MDPILISSPVRRCGTTLIQRLLCSSSNCLIYGENCANDIMMTSNMIFTKKMIFSSSREWRNKQLDTVLKGNVNQWIPDLMPDMDEYLETYAATMHAIIAFYKSFAAKKGRPLWGAKLPEWNVHHLLQLYQNYPDIKIIYLFRPLADCLRSAKAMGMVQNMEDVQFFCQSWKHNSDYMRQHLRGERIMWLHYEELVSHPHGHLEKIAAFTDASDMDVAVFEHKVNDYTNPDRNADLNYIQPSELEEKEWEMVRSMDGSQ